MLRSCIALSALFLTFVAIGCGDTEPTDGSNGDSNNTSVAETCETSGNAVADAIRALDRSCESDVECRIVERAGDCECANSVNIMADLTAFDSALQTLDENMCVHPFASCGSVQCDYTRGYREPELIGTCEQNECVVTETMTCAEFEENVYGGLVAPSRCETAEDCTLRNDLNPCGCNEAVGLDFPFLSAQSTYDLIGINRDRCNFTCEACPQVTTAACVQNVCVAQ